MWGSRRFEATGSEDEVTLGVMEVGFVYSWRWKWFF